MESSLTPREIQVRIRHGQTPEEVTDAAGIARETIEGYILPVLAEREHVCENARDTIVRRRHVAGTEILLGDLVDSAIRARGARPEDAVWDSWRNDDGRWTLIISSGSETATFSYDIQGRYIVAADQPARDLVGDIASPEPGSTDTALADAIEDDVAHEPESDSAAETPEDPESTDTPPGVSSLKAARQRRAMEQLALSDEYDTPENSDTMPSDGAAANPDTTQAVPDEVPTHRKGRQHRRRVPSWDEIMFGGDRE